MSSLTFRFSLDKVINALAFFAEQGVKDLTKLKAVKLLYLADRHHLLHYGRPITGDRYVAMDLGPVPESGFQLVGRIIEPVEVDDEARDRALVQLRVDRGFLRRYPVLRAKRSPDMDVFSESEVEALRAVLKEFGRTRARDLVELTHQHRAYQHADAGRAPGSSVSLPYEYFFEDAPDDLRGVLALAEHEQEDRDFAAQLRNAGEAALSVRTGTGRR